MAYKKNIRTGKTKHTIICPFTRIWAVPRFFESLANSDVPFEECHFAAYIDHEDADLISDVSGCASDIPFGSITIYVTEETPPAENAGTWARRIRQGKMRQGTFQLIKKGTDKLLLLEDDTTVPEKTWSVLSKRMEEGYDWVSGFEVGRWPGGQCAGIWRYDRGYLRSLMPGDSKDCDATGVYLVMTTPAVYTKYPWDVYDNEWGQDVTVTYLLKRDGYRLGVAWELECIHMTETKDFTCDMVHHYSRHVGECSPMHISVMVPPHLANSPASRKRYTLGIDVLMDGKQYRKGQYVSEAEVCRMSKLGLIQAKFPCP